MTLPILYCDNHLLIAAKPAGVPTQPDFEADCRAWRKAHTGKLGEAYLYVAHRLDTPVSGIVICACTSKALTRLHAAIRAGTVQKRYLALVAGTLPADTGVLEHYLFHDMQRRCALVTHASAPHAKRAQLSYRVLKQVQRQTLVEIDLITGRYHQIRAQLSAVGCPILGDAKYGSKEPFQPGVIALHHAYASVPHPTQGVACEVEAPLPPYWP